MAVAHTVRAQLRAATIGAHERVDAVFSRFELTSADDYTRFLHAQGGALIPLERALDAGAAPGLPIAWGERRRSPALLHDLAELGRAGPDTAPLAPIESAEDALGTIYVLEGSRLGGALLKRSLPSSFPAEFLAPAPSRLWRDLLDVLEVVLQTPEQRKRATAAAMRAFDLFEASGQAVLAAETAR